MRTLAIVAAVATLAPAAHAADGTVAGSVGFFAAPGEGSRLVVVECNARASSGSVRDVPVTTSVACTIEGIEQRGVAPGPFAATAFAAVVSETFDVCVTATAVFFDATANAVYPVTDPWYCTEIHL